MHFRFRVYVGAKISRDPNKSFTMHWKSNYYFTLLKLRRINIDSIPEQYQSQRLWDYLIMESRTVADPTQIPTKYQHATMWHHLTIVSGRITDLNQIPYKYQTISIWEHLVKQGYITSPKKVPKEFQSIDIWYHFVITGRIDSPMRIPEQFQSQKLWNYLVIEKNIIVDHTQIPEKFKQQAIWDHLIKSEKIKSRQEIPGNYQIDQIWTKWIEKDPTLICYLPDHLKIVSFLKSLVQTNRSLSYYIPIELREQVLSDFFELFEKTGDLYDLYGLILTNKEFNKLIADEDIRFYKWTTNNGYAPGLNRDLKQFDPHSKKSGITFSTEKRINERFKINIDYKWRVEIPDDEGWIKIKGYGRLKATQLILSEPIKLPSEINLCRSWHKKMQSSDGGGGYFLGQIREALAHKDFTKLQQLCTG